MNHPVSQLKPSALLAVMLLVASLCLAAADVVQPQLPDPGSVSGITRQDQEVAGLKAMDQVYKQMPVLPDSSPVTQYVQELGRKLVPVIPADKSWPYQFHVIPEKEINAFALPGGPIFINLGTIQAADNEAELAGVMAHEMSHIYMQHSAKQAVKASLFQGILGILGSLLPGNKAGAIARLGVQIGAGTILLKYSREDEAQADAVGAIIMYDAGFNPRAMAEFFQKLEQQGGSGNGLQFLSDHPNPGNRVAAVDQEIRDWPRKNYLPTSPAFVDARQLADKMQTYTAQQIADGAKQGIWARQNAQNGAIPPGQPPTTSSPNNTPANQQTGNLAKVSYEQVKPSGSFTTLQYNSFSISAPSNWRATGNASSTINIAPPAGVGQGAIAYGVVINTTKNQNASTLDQATLDVIQNLEQSNPGMQLSGTPRAIRVNGAIGRSANLTSTSPVLENGKPLAELDWLIVLPRPNGGLVYLIFIAPQNQFNRLSQTYKTMLNSLRLK
jgi:Zn-dependent protease with chaperone function